MTEEETLEPQPHPLTKGVGEVVKDILAEHAPKAAEHGKKAAAAGRKEFLEELEQYNAGVLGQLVDALRASGSFPPELDKMFDAIRSPDAQIGGILSSFFVYGVMFQVAGTLMAPFLQQAANDIWKKFPTRPVSPADLATGAVRGIVPGGQAITSYPADINTIAAESGLDAQAMQFLADITGNPPSPQDLLEMFRRGIITMPEVATGLREGDTRDEWIAQFQKLAYTWLTPIDFVRAAVQEQMDYSTAETWAAKTGLDTTTDVFSGGGMFDLAFAIAGRPPGPEEAGRMANRGIIPWTGTGHDAVSFQSVIAESDLKTKYTAALQALQAYVPPPRMVGGLLSKGGITAAQAQSYWEMSGVPTDLAKAYVFEASQEATQLEKLTGKGDVLNAYFDGVIDRATAKELLVLLGYGGHYVPSATFTIVGQTPPAVTDNLIVADVMLDIVDFRRELKALNAEVNRIGTYYRNYKIDATEAQSNLTTLGVPAEQISGLMEIWAVDRVIPNRLPNAGQIAKAVKYQTLTQAQALAKLEILGYTAEDAAIVLSADGEFQVTPLPAQTGNPPPAV